MNHNCLEHLDFSHTIDTVTWGDIDSKAVFVCEICGKEYSEEEIKGGLYDEQVCAG